MNEDDCLEGTSKLDFPAEERGSGSYNAITVYPNPFNHQLTVELKLAEVAMVELRVFDAVGRLVLNQQPGQVEDGIVLLDLGGQPAGTYYVQVLTGSEVTVKKVLKME